MLSTSGTFSSVEAIPLQIWANLSREHQQAVLSLLVQLAVRCVVRDAAPATTEAQKEAVHAP